MEKSSSSIENYDFGSSKHPWEWLSKARGPWQSRFKMGGVLYGCLFPFVGWEPYIPVPPHKQTISVGLPAFQSIPVALPLYEFDKQALSRTWRSMLPANCRESKPWLKVVLALILPSLFSLLVVGAALQYPSHSSLAGGGTGITWPRVTFFGVQPCPSLAPSRSDRSWTHIRSPWKALKGLF